MECGSTLATYCDLHRFCCKWLPGRPIIQSPDAIFGMGRRRNFQLDILAAAHCDLTSHLSIDAARGGVDFWAV